MDATAEASRELRIVADPTRASILRSMLEAPEGRVLTGRLAGELELRQPTVSHHLRALLDEGLVQKQPEGRRTWYSIAPDRVDRLAAILRTEQASSSLDTSLDHIVDNLAFRFACTRSNETCLPTAWDWPSGWSIPTTRWWVV